MDALNTGTTDTRLERLKDYFTGKKTYVKAETGKKMYNRMRQHINGEFPSELINERRPNEPDEILEYRKKIYASKSQHPANKVIQALSKIRRSQDYKVTYDSSKIPAYIAKDSTPQKYFEEGYPVYGNLDNWLFDEGLVQLCMDGQAIICVLPHDINFKPNEYIKPTVHIINIDLVLEFIEGELFVFKSPVPHVKKTEDGREEKQEVFIAIDTKEATGWVKDAGGNYVNVLTWKHGMDELPAFEMKGMYSSKVEGQVIWKTPLEPMRPHLDEIAREYSDLQAEKVLHIFSEKWQLNTNECKKCKTQGVIPAPGFTDSRKMIKCPDCNGLGFMPISPFKSRTINIDSNKLGSGMPIPPAGYINKPTEITKLLDESVDKHSYQALAAVNMEHLASVNLNQSGIAKEWDREEPSNFAYKVASLLMRVRNLTSYYIVKARYGTVTNMKPEVLNDLVPKVSIPKKYDMITAGMLMAEYQTAQTAKASPLILMNMEMELAAKRFVDNPEVVNLVKLTYKLDPLAGITEEDKVLRLQNKGIAEMDYIVSSNIGKFIKKAMHENPKFDTLEYEQQMEQLQQYAQDIMNANSAKAQVVPGGQ